MPTDTHTQRQALLAAFSRQMLRMVLAPVAALLLSVQAFAQVTINFAGTQTTVPATGVSAPTNVAVDSSGNLYIVDLNLTSVLKITPSGTQTSLGSGLGGPLGLAVDGSGNVYVADTGNARVVEITPGGTQTLVGSGWTAPTCVAADNAGNVYVCDSTNAYELPSGGGSLVTIPKGNGGGAQYGGIAIDNNTGYVYLLDRGNGGIGVWNRINAVYYLDIGTTILSPHSFSMDSAGILYIASNATNLVQAFDESGNPVGNYGTAINEPYGAASDGKGNIYIANFNTGVGGSVYKEALGGVNLGSNNACLSTDPNATNCSQAVTLNFNSTSLGSTGTELHVVTQGYEGKGQDYTAMNDSCSGNDLGPNGGCSVTVTFAPSAAGVRFGAVEVASQPFVQSDVRRQLRPHPNKAAKPAVALQSGNVLQSTAFLSGIGLAPIGYFEQAPIGTLPLILDNNVYLSGLAVDVHDNLYVVDNTNCIVTEQPLFNFSSVTPTLVAGIPGNCSSQADGSSGPSTTIEPWRVAVNGRGDVYILEEHHYVVRKVDANTGLVSTVAGTMNSPGLSGDGGPATSAQLRYTYDIAVDGADNLYIADSTNDSVRRVDGVTGIITTVAGSYIAGARNPGYSGDNGPATSAQLNFPIGVVLDAAGNLYIADQENYVIRKVDATTGIITTFAGNHTSGISGDGGPATLAQLSDDVEGLGIDAGGNLYISDSDNNSVRRVDAVTGIITTVAGSYLAGAPNAGYTGDGGPATLATLNYNEQAIVDPYGDLVIADSQNNVVRGVPAADASASFATIAAGVYSPAQDFTLLNDGNAPLVLTAITTSTNFDTGGADTTCNSSTTLNESQTCVLGIRFAPTAAGSFTGTAVGSDNAPYPLGPGEFLINLSGTATAGVDAKLGIGGVPATLTPGGNPGTITVSVEYANGVADPGATNAITLVVTGPGGFSQSFSGTAVNGVASFDLSSLMLPAGVYTYTATSSPLTPGTATTTVAAADSQLGLSNVPATLPAGGNPGTVSVSVEGPSGTVDTTATNPVTLTVVGPGGFSQSFTANAVNGVASFNLSSLALTAPGTYNVIATSGNLAQAVGSIVVGTGGGAQPPTQVALSNVPDALPVGGNPGMVSAAILFPNNSLATAATNAVTLTVTGPDGYSQTFTVNAASGLANFDLSSLTLTAPGTYTVTATSNGLTQAVNTIVVGGETVPAQQLALGGVPASVAIGGNPGTVTVQTLLAGNVVNTEDTNAVTLTVTGPGGFSQSFVVNSAAGVANFDLSSLALPMAGTYTVTATEGGASQAVGSIVVGSSSSTPAPTQVVLAGLASILPAGGNPGILSAGILFPDNSVDSNASNTVVLTITGPDGYAQTFTSSAAAGVASFDLSNLVLTTPGVYTFTTTSEGLTQSVSTLTVGGTQAAQQLAFGGVPATVTQGGNPGTITVSTLLANNTVNTADTSAVTLTITGPGGFTQTYIVNSAVGVATFNLSSLALSAAGTYTLTATEGGASQAIGTIVVASTADFTIAGTPTGSTPIEPGNSASFTITLAPVNGTFPSAITLTATGLPAGATYSFSPATVTPGSGSVTSTLTIVTAKSGATTASLSDGSQAAGMGAIALGILMLPLAGSRRMRKALQRMPLAVAALALLSLGAFLGLSGCGAGGLFSQPQQSYTITVTGTSGALSHSTTVTLTVQ